MILGLSAFYGSGLVSAHDNVKDDPVRCKYYKSIQIHSGDTLWNIAKSNQESNGYYKGKDIRYIMNDIAQINNIEKSNLKIDQELLVPMI